MGDSACPTKKQIGNSSLAFAVQASTVLTKRPACRSLREVTIFDVVPLGALVVVVVDVLRVWLRGMPRAFVTHN